jgi:hypothetical protein
VQYRNQAICHITRFSHNAHCACTNCFFCVCYGGSTLWKCPTVFVYKLLLLLFGWDHSFISWNILLPFFISTDFFGEIAYASINSIISTNNIATGMVRGGCKYAFNSPKYAFISLVFFVRQSSAPYSEQLHSCRGGTKLEGKKHATTRRPWSDVPIKKLIGWPDQYSNSATIKR